MELDVPDEAEAEDDALDLSLPDGALTPQMEAVGLATADKLAVRFPSHQHPFGHRAWLGLGLGGFATRTDSPALLSVLACLALLGLRLLDFLLAVRSPTEHTR